MLMKEASVEEQSNFIQKNDRSLTEVLNETNFEKVR